MFQTTAGEFGGKENLDMDRIVVIRPGALGDVILTFPAVRALRVQHPDAHITVVGSPSLWELAGNLVNERISIDAARFSTLYAEEPREDLRRWLEGVDRVIAWTVQDPSPALRAAGVVDVIHVCPYPPAGKHVSEWLCTAPPPGSPLPQGEKGGLTSGTVLPSPLAGEGAGVRGGPIIIHPGAGAVWKRWTAERFAAVGNALRQLGHEVMLVEGPADGEAVARCQAAVSVPFPVLRDRTLPQLAAELASASLFIGNDSGVTHLAATAGAPTIALFGPTDPATWAPLGTVRILRHCGAQATEPRQIRVCDGDCLEQITVEEVLSAADSFLTVDNRVDNLDGRASRDASRGR